jgi:uncharacterized membrane protein YbhN (UPF0104 family)
MAAKNIPAWYRKALLFGLLLITAALISKSISDNLSELKSYVVELDFILLGISTFLFCGSLLVQGLYNLSLVSDYRINKLDNRRMFREYFISRLVRYVPGKIWGMYYHSERLSDAVPRSVIWSANLVQFSDANLFSCIVIFGFLVYVKLGTALAIFSLALFLVVFFWIQKKHIVASLLMVLVKKLKINVSELVYPTFSSKNALLRIFMLCVDWLFFILAWIVLSSGYLPLSSAVSLSILYAGASLIGLAVVIVPSGLFIREASFIALAAWFGYDETLAALLSIIARLLLTTADVLMGITFFVVSNKRNANKG